MTMAEDIEHFELDFMGTFRTTEFRWVGIHENFNSGGEVGGGS